MSTLPPPNPSAGCRRESKKEYFIDEVTKNNCVLGAKRGTHGFVKLLSLRYNNGKFELSAGGGASSLERRKLLARLEFPTESSDKLVLLGSVHDYPITKVSLELIPPSDDVALVDVILKTYQFTQKYSLLREEDCDSSSVRLVE